MRKPADREENVKRILIVPCVLALLGACSVQQVAISSPFAKADNPEPGFVLDGSTTISAKNAADTVLLNGTSWSRVGSMEHGDVFRTRDQVVIVNSFNVHEAYIVVRDNTVAGYYLPVEKTFVAAKPAEINLVRKEIRDER